MYDEGVTQRSIEKIEAQLGIKLKRYSPAESHELTTELNRLNGLGKLYAPSGAIANADHAAFVKNERILFQQDFLYACRYIKIEKDSVEGGGVGHLADTFWDSQRILLDLMAKLERKNEDDFSRGYPCDGIKICDNKGGRALGHTAIARGVIVHRLVSWPYTRALAASTNEPKILEVYKKDKIMLDGLPFFLVPTGWPDEGYDKKGEHIQFPDAHGSKILYQHDNQDSGIGTGSQFDVNHNTELSEWKYADQLQLDFFPTLGQNPKTFSLQETTPKGRKGWWFTWSEAIRKGEITGWAYLYIPFYAEKKKYRRHPPEGWVPNDATMQLAWKVNQTSHEFVGHQVTLSREQMYWWETSYNDAQAENALNKFLSNYSITPEMSFQHTSASAINPQTLDWMRQTSTMPEPYTIQGL